MKTRVVSIGLLSQFNCDDPATRNGDVNNHTSYWWTCPISRRKIKSTRTLQHVLRILQTTITRTHLRKLAYKIRPKATGMAVNGHGTNDLWRTQAKLTKTERLYRQETIWLTINDCNNKRQQMWLLKQNWKKQKRLYRQETIWLKINVCNNKRLWLWRWLPDTVLFRTTPWRSCSTYLWIYNYCSFIVLLFRSLSRSDE